MRRHFYLITGNGRNEDRVGGVSIDSTRRPRAKKNEERVSDKRDLDTGETWEEWYVSLGYYDFEDEDDYEENGWDVVQEKLAEIDEEHLEKAGLDPEEVLA
jgi:hypothetical protein